MILPYNQCKLDLFGDNFSINGKVSVIAFLEYHLPAQVLYLAH